MPYRQVDSRLTFQSKAPDPGGLKIWGGFLNFAPLTLTSQEWAPALSKGMVKLDSYALRFLVCEHILGITAFGGVLIMVSLIGIIVRISYLWISCYNIP